MSSNLFLICQWRLWPLNFLRWKAKHTNPNPVLLQDLFFYLWREWKAFKDRLAKSSNASLKSHLFQTKSLLRLLIPWDLSILLLIWEATSSTVSPKVSQTTLKIPYKKTDYFEKHNLEQHRVLVFFFNFHAAFSPQTLVQGYVSFQVFLEPMYVSAPWQHFLVSSIEGVDIIKKEFSRLWHYLRFMKRNRALACKLSKGGVLILCFQMGRFLFFFFFWWKGAFPPYCSKLFYCPIPKPASSSTARVADVSV